MSELDKIRMGRGKLGRVVVMRLAPGADLLKSLQEIAQQEKLAAGVILSGAGSLSRATLRNVRSFPEEFPITDRNRNYTPKQETLELVSLTGNISLKNGEPLIHCHVTVSSGTEDGKAYGGHLVEGCIVFSTCEVVLAELTGIEMTRHTDPETRAFELYL